MRDPERMRPLLEAVLTAWQQHPDLRLTQLLWSFAAGPGESAPVFFYTEDDVLQHRLEGRSWTTADGQVITEDDAARRAGAFEADDDVPPSAPASP